MKAGLEDIIAGESAICYIDGEKGILAYRGYNIHELATNSTFEETCHLLWFGRLPKQAELADTTKKLVSSRAIQQQIIDWMKTFPRKALPMEVLRTTKALDIALILHADHEWNASTFAGRVTAATLSDIYSAVTSAIGALKGPLHGGANEAVMRMLEQIGEPSKVDQYVRNLFAQKKK